MPETALLATDDRAAPLVRGARLRRSILVLGPPAVAATLAMVAALIVAGGAPVAPPAGLPDAGAVVGWSVPVLRLLFDLCAIATVGGLLVAAVLAPAGRHDGPAAAALRSAAAWSAAWVVTALADAGLTLSNITGIPLQRLSGDDVLPSVWALAPTRALLVSAALALVVLACSLAARSRLAAGPQGLRLRQLVGVALGVAVIGVTPSMYAGHSTHTGEFATGSLVVHVVAATVWLGGLLGLALHLRASDRALLPAVSRFSTIALGCYVALLATGLLVGLAGLGADVADWWSPYAAVLLVKIVAAIGLGVIGWSHRRWTLDQLAAGRPLAFARLIVIELAVMGVTVGLAVALSRTPGASGTGLLERSTRAVGPGSFAEPLSVGTLLADWRPEPVLSAVVLCLFAAYLGGVRRLMRHGHSWPAGRNAAALGGGVVALGFLGLPVSYDANPLFAVQTAQHLALVFVVPALVCLSRAGALTSMSGPTVSPTTGFVVLVASTAAVLSSPLQAYSATNPAGHVVSLSISALAGLVLCRAMFASGAAASAPSRLARERAVVLALAVLYLIGFGVALATRSAGMDLGEPPIANQVRISDDLQAAALTTWLGAALVGALGALALRRRAARFPGNSPAGSAPASSSPKALASEGTRPMG